MKEEAREAVGQFDLRPFVRDIIIYSAGNGLLTLFGFIQGLIVPKNLSMADFGYWELFILYTSYIGILHLGFLDGFLIKWAGKRLEEVTAEINTALVFLLLEQLAIILPLSLFFYLFVRGPQQWILLMIGVYALINNLMTFFLFITQAARKFRVLTTVLVARGGLFLMFILLLLALHDLKYQHVIAAYLVTYFLILSVFFLWFRQHITRKIPSVQHLWAYGKQHINIGFLVLLGNFGVVLFMSIDRMMVSSLLPIDKFAVYAFAWAIAVTAYSFVRAIAEVFFPYISGTRRDMVSRVYDLGKTATILVWAAISAIYFPIVWIVRIYLPQYVASLTILKILLGTVGFGSICLILHIGLYKTYRKQRRYFAVSVIVLALASVLILVARSIWGTLESISAALLVSFVLWYILNELNLKTISKQSNRSIFRSLLTIFCNGGILWLASSVDQGQIVQLLVYACLFLLINWLFFRHELLEIYGLILGEKGVLTSIINKATRRAS